MSDATTYVDGFVAADPTANKAAYLEHARLFDGKRLNCGGFAVLLQQ